MFPCSGHSGRCLLFPREREKQRGGIAHRGMCLMQHSLTPQANPRLSAPYRPLGRQAKGLPLLNDPTKEPAPQVTVAVQPAVEEDQPGTYNITVSPSFVLCSCPKKGQIHTYVPGWVEPDSLWYVVVNPSRRDYCAASGLFVSLLMTEMLVTSRTVVSCKMWLHQAPQRSPRSLSGSLPSLQLYPDLPDLTRPPLVYHLGPLDQT
jgi:hypothetical protein